MDQSLSDIIWMMTYNSNCGFDNKHPRYQTGVKRSADTTWSQYEQQEAKRRMLQQQQTEKQLKWEKIQQALIARSIKLRKPSEKKTTKKKVTKKKNKKTKVSE